MRVSFATLPLLAVLVLLVVPTSATIWLKSFNDDSCTSPSGKDNNIGAIVSGQCTLGPSGYSYSVTCSGDGTTATVTAYYTRSRNGAASCTSSSMYDKGVYSGAVSGCVTASSSSGSSYGSFKVYCDESSSSVSALRANLVKEQAFSDAACTSSLFTQYSDVAINTCKNSTDGNFADDDSSEVSSSSQSWIADGSVREWSFSGAGCSVSKATAVSRSPLDSCIGLYDDGLNSTVYYKSSAPSSGVGASIPSALSAFPPSGSIVTSACSRSDCGTTAGGVCYATSATLLSTCVQNSRQSDTITAAAQYCTASGYLGTYSWFNQTSCSAAVDQVYLTGTGRGTCDDGSFTSCGSISSDAPSTTHMMASVDYDNDATCTQATGIRLTRAGYCQSYGGSDAFSTKYTRTTSSNNYTVLSYQSVGCTGTAIYSSVYGSDCQNSDTSRRYSSRYSGDYTVPNTGYFAAGATSGVALPAGGDPDYPSSSSSGGSTSSSSSSSSASAVSSFLLTLDLDLSTASADTIAGYKAQLRTDVASALSVLSSRVVVKSLTAVSSSSSARRLLANGAVAEIEVTGAPSGAASTMAAAHGNSAAFPLLSKNTGVQDTTFSAAAGLHAPFATLAALIAAVVLAAVRA